MSGRQPLLETTTVMLWLLRSRPSKQCRSRGSRRCLQDELVFDRAGFALDFCAERKLPAPRHVQGRLELVDAGLCARHGRDLGGHLLHAVRRHIKTCRENNRVGYGFAVGLVDETDRDDRVALLDGLIDELELVVFDVGARERGRTGYGNANERGLEGARVGVALHLAILDILMVPRTTACVYTRGFGAAQPQTAWLRRSGRDSRRMVRRGASEAIGDQVDESVG